MKEEEEYIDVGLQLLAAVQVACSPMNLAIHVLTEKAMMKYTCWIHSTSKEYKINKAYSTIVIACVRPSKPQKSVIEHYQYTKYHTIDHF